MLRRRSGRAKNILPKLQTKLAHKFKGMRKNTRSGKNIRFGRVLRACKILDGKSHQVQATLEVTLKAPCKKMTVRACGLKKIFRVVLRAVLREPLTTSHTSTTTIPAIESAVHCEMMI